MLALPEGEEDDFLASQAEAGKPIESQSARQVQQAVKQWKEAKSKKVFVTVANESFTDEENLSADSAFCDLKIIYHGSEDELESTDGTIYLSESVLTGEVAYKFLFEFKAAKAKGKFKTWLEFSYKGYEHGKFLLSAGIAQSESITTFLRRRLDKNRQQLLQNPQELRPYIAKFKVIRADELLHRISLESKFFQSVMDEFEQEENSYLSNNPELLQM